MNEVGTGSLLFSLDFGTHFIEDSLSSPSMSPKDFALNLSREGGKAQKEWNVEETSSEIVDAAFHLHRDLGPGLLESVYEVVLAKQLEQRGLAVERQKDVAITYNGLAFDVGFRADLLVERKVLVELKSVG